MKVRSEGKGEKDGEKVYMKKKVGGKINRVIEIPVLRELIRNFLMSSLHGAGSLLKIYLSFVYIRSGYVNASKANIIINI